MSKAIKVKGRRKRKEGKMGVSAPDGGLTRSAVSLAPSMLTLSAVSPGTVLLKLPVAETCVSLRV